MMGRSIIYDLAYKTDSFCQNFAADNVLNANL